MRGGRGREGELTTGHAGHSQRGAQETRRPAVKIGILLFEEIAITFLYIIKCVGGNDRLNRNRYTTKLKRRYCENVFNILLERTLLFLMETYTSVI